MKKILIGIALVIIVLFVVFSFQEKKVANTSGDIVYQNTITISRAYAALRVKTDRILNKASEYPDYNTWNQEMTALIAKWENLEAKANKLEAQANAISGNKTSFNLINKAHAYTKDEISNVFDKAPAGKKIRTLAKYLGVDAKRAYQILQNDQEFVKADAWNEAGDTFKKLEVSAIVIKDGCKVAGFIGAAAMTGGATAGASLGSAGVGSALLGGSAGLTEGTIMIIAGTDLMLEVSEDAATISLGDENKVSKSISKIRSVTDPAASLLSLKDIPKNISKGAKLLDKVGVVLVQIDQIRSMTQDGKLLGINITPDSKIEVAAIEEDEMEKWIESEWGEKPYEEDGYSDDLEEWLGGFEDLDDWLDDAEDEEAIEENEEGVAVEEKASEEDEKVLVENEKASEEESDDPQTEDKDTDDKYSAKKVYGKDGTTHVSIVAPNEKSLTYSAMLLKAEIGGYTRASGEKYQCYWTWYVNGVKEWEDVKSCASTRSIPSSWEPGTLKLEVRVEFTKTHYEPVGDYAPGEVITESKKIEDVFDTITAERYYELLPPPVDTHVYGQ